MDEPMGNSGGWDAWAQAITGNAINAAVDRVMHRPQYMSDPSIQYGMDANGNLYQLGQPNGQVTAQVQQTAARASGTTIFGVPTWLVLAGAVLYFTVGRK